MGASRFGRAWDDALAFGAWPARLFPRPRSNVWFLFDGDPGADADAPSDPLATELAAWLTAAPSFRTFAEAHREKIRKKLRGAVDPEARRDVQAELRTAHLLLAERRIELAFEAYGSGKPGPDFTVSFRGERSFNLEGMRRNPDVASYGWALLAKLRQLPPSVPNAVLLAIDGEHAMWPNLPGAKVRLEIAAR